MKPKWVRLLVGAGVVAALFYFFGEKRWLGTGITHLEWIEDVELASGEIIKVERDVKFRWRFLFGSGRAPDEVKYSAVRPAEQAADFPEWRAPMLPILLEKDLATGAWWIVATTRQEEFWHRNQQPQPPYWAFTTEKNRWVRASVPEFIWGRAANLFVRFDYDDSRRKLKKTVAERKIKQGPRFKNDFTVVVDKSMRCLCMPSDLPQISSDELDLREFRRR